MNRAAAIPDSADRSLWRYGRLVVNHSYLILVFRVFRWWFCSSVLCFLISVSLLLKVPHAKAHCRLTPLPPNKTFIDLRFVMEPHLKHHPDILSRFSQRPVTRRQKAKITFKVKKKKKQHITFHCNGELLGFFCTKNDCVPRKIRMSNSRPRTGID